jgi:uncharacterized repeat protein (TIGR03803 family)
MRIGLMKTESPKTYLRLTALLAVVICGGSIAAHAQKIAAIWSFTDSNGQGAYPLSPPLFDSAGAIYDTTTIGGTGQFGTVFKLAQLTKGGAWTQSILYDFSGGFDGQQPQNIVAGGNALYGTTVLGGSDNCYQGCGTVFELTPTVSGPWTKTLLYEFLGFDDGQAPGNLRVGKGGVLYGTTPSGGPGTAQCQHVGCGTVFALTPPAEKGASWTKSILYSFPASKTDGRAPNADILLDRDGNIYGTTYYGGNAFYGTVWELSPPGIAGGAWTETILHNFTGASDGGYPIGGLTLAGNGTVYGTASFSGIPNDSGTAFQLLPPAVAGGAWTYTVLHTFAGGKDGATPATTMAFDTKGNLYGTTFNGGSTACYLGCGTLFKLAPTGTSWTESVLLKLPNSGETPNASIVVFRDGLLYGTAAFLGASNFGEILTLAP